MVNRVDHWFKTLTLFQPKEGGADYDHHILMSPPSYESHRQACHYSVLVKVSLAWSPFSKVAFLGNFDFKLMISAWFPNPRFNTFFFYFCILFLIFRLTFYFFFLPKNFGILDRRLGILLRNFFPAVHIPLAAHFKPPPTFFAAFAIFVPWN